MNDERDRLLAIIHAAINAGELRLGENRPDELADALVAHGVRLVPADAVVVTEDALKRALEASDPQLRRTHTFGDPAFFRDWARIVLAALRGEAR